MLDFSDLPGHRPVFAVALVAFSLFWGTTGPRTCFNLLGYMLNLREGSAVSGLKTKVEDEASIRSEAADLEASTTASGQRSSSFGFRCPHMDVAKNFGAPFGRPSQKES